MSDLKFPENQQIRTTNMSEDALPITGDDECSTALGMFYVDDYNLYNDIIHSGNAFKLSLVDRGDTGPPYWLKIEKLTEPVIGPTEQYLLGYREGYVDADNGADERYSIE